MVALTLILAAGCKGEQPVVTVATITPTYRPTLPVPRVASPTPQPTQRPSTTATATSLPPSATPTRSPEPISTATASPTPTTTVAPTVKAKSDAPAPPPVTAREGTWEVLAYPFEEHLQREPSEEAPGFAFWRLDWDAYQASAPQAAPATFPSLTLENRWLRITVVPALGGRVVELIFKPTGHNELYQNPVLKPTHWGPREQGWWLAAGGMEWCLPVPEHGYLWPEAWEARVEEERGAAAVILQSPEGLPLAAQITVRLPADQAALHLEIRIHNQTAEEIAFAYWTNAMLAPGGRARPSPELRFVLPQDQVVIHSTGDPRLPRPGQVASWPQWSGIHLDRLGEWEGWLGFFAHPQAREGFAGVYDPEVDEGVVRIFPPEQARGLKGFAFGYGDRSPSPDEWTDGGSTYVELHGGLTPTFNDRASLQPGEELAWEEVWYPVAGLGGLTHATAQVAIHLVPAEGGHQLTIHSTGETRGTLVISLSDGQVRLRQEVALTPNVPLQVSLAEYLAESGEPIEVRLLDETGHTLYVHRLEPTQ